MANSILSSLLSTPSLSIVSSQTGLDSATNLNVSRVAFKFRARAMRHMREDGTTIVDARIILPAVVELDVICGTLDALTQANALALDRAGTYTVTSKGIVLGNMMAEEMNIKQTADMISASPVRISMKQLLTQDNSAPPQMEQAADSSMFDRGIQSPAVATFPASLVSTVSNFASTAVKTVSGALTDATGSAFVLDESDLS